MKERESGGIGIKESNDSSDLLIKMDIQETAQEIVKSHRDSLSKALDNGYLDLSLLKEASVSLIFSICGLIAAGMILDKVQHVDVFIQISELIILVPVLLNLKGNLELNLTARLGTAVRF
jgi:cation transporter-like permease